MKLFAPFSIGLSLVIVLISFTGGLGGQDFAPPKAKPIDPKVQRLISEKLRVLGLRISSLKKQGLTDPWLADLEVYYNAVNLIIEHNEFYQPVFAQWTLEALDRGLFRASLASTGNFPWLQQRGHAVVRGYRSHIDGSVQPYAVTLPKDYAKNPKKKWRIDVVLHGRDKTLNEVKFLHRHNGDKGAPPQDFIQLDIYGRGNNAYRWAGEKDVLEAFESFVSVERMFERSPARLLGRADLLDPKRVVLRGFSMGGAGAWHLGLHMPDQWCVVGPGAGFTTTHGYVGNLPAKLPSWQEACLHIYDAADYAENVFDVPVVAYAGSKDAQLQAARNIQKRLKEFSFADKMTLLVAPGLAHRFPPEWQKKAEKEYARYVAKGKPDYPDRVRFVTYTLKYPSCYWVDILGLEKHYRKALIDAKKLETGFEITTKNVSSFHLALPEGASRQVNIDIDGQKFSTRAATIKTIDRIEYHLYLKKNHGQWKTVLPQFLATERLRTLQKTTGLQGPIDDAFTDAFLCVRGTGKTWHEATHKYTEANLERFRREWRKYLRGDLPIKDDADVTAQDIAAKHLILFGDPSSNSLIRQVIDGLPVRWDAKTIQMGTKSFSAKDHAPVMIYPSPLNAQRYVVLNSGHTFHESDFRGTNALLFPRLGDYAVLRLTPTDANPLSTEVATAGIFDEHWRFPGKGDSSATQK